MGVAPLHGPAADMPTASGGERDDGGSIACDFDRPGGAHAAPTRAVECDGGRSVQAVSASLLAHEICSLRNQRRVVEARLAHFETQLDVLWSLNASAPLSPQPFAQRSSLLGQDGAVALTVMRLASPREPLDDSYALKEDVRLRDASTEAPPSSASSLDSLPWVARHDEVECCSRASSSPGLDVGGSDCDTDDVCTPAVSMPSIAFGEVSASLREVHLEYQAEEAQIVFCEDLVDFLQQQASYVGEASRDGSCELSSGW
mmetsp:Transcript_6923/g.19491  ORF Transcript_6923/g.19491 Transcript_6923/m.19491 type:complete len:259 (-) Transcript_6923:491-1267(-)